MCDEGYRIYEIDHVGKVDYQNFKDKDIWITKDLAFYGDKELAPDQNGVFWIEEDGKCIGYCGGFVLDGSDAYGSASGMTQFGFSTAVKIMIRKPWLFFHPEIRARYPFIITNIKRRLKKMVGLNEKPTQPAPIVQSKFTGIPAGLVVIGVDPAHHKKGIGSLLQQEFERIAREKGADYMQLSVRKENAQAISSYKRNGWTIEEDQRIAFGMKKKL
jgi:ribosomal protein S18 acetylase RimI-like enzyme